MKAQANTEDCRGYNKSSLIDYSTEEATAYTTTTNLKVQMTAYTKEDISTRNYKYRPSSYRKHYEGNSSGMPYYQRDSDGGYVKVPIDLWTGVTDSAFFATTAEIGEDNVYLVIPSGEYTPSTAPDIHNFQYVPSQGTNVSNTFYIAGGSSAGDDIDDAVE